MSASFELQNAKNLLQEYIGRLEAPPELQIHYDDKSKTTRLIKLVECDLVVDCFLARNPDFREYREQLVSGFPRNVLGLDAELWDAECNRTTGK